MRLRHYINEKITLTGEKDKDKWLAQLEKWKGDLRKMTKIYQSLKAEDTPQAVKEFKEANKLFIQFRQNWEKFYTQFGGKMIGNDEPMLAKEVRVTGWQAETSFSNFFPDAYDYNLKTHVPAPWELDRGRRRGDTRKNKILVYQKAFKKAFDAIETLIKNKFDVVKPDTEEKINVAGINLIITKDMDTGNWTHKNIKMFVDILPKAVQAIKKAGFSKPLRGVTVRLEMTERSGNNTKGGEYHSNDNTLSIYKWGIADKTSALRTLVHELGHLYYRTYLTQKARDAWDKAIWNSFITVEKKHVEEFFNAHIFNKVEPNDEGYYYVDKPQKNRIIATIKKTENDPSRKAIFDYIVHNLPFKATLDKAKDELDGARIHIEFISDYARKNTEEAFCEAFAIYVNQRGKLGEWTREFFKEIARSGGANIKEEKQMDLVEKYLHEETLRSDKLSLPKQGKTKEFSIHSIQNKIQVIVSSETPNPTAVSGVRNSISRKNFDTEEEAIKFYDKSIQTHLKKGWEKRDKMWRKIY